MQQGENIDVVFFGFVIFFWELVAEVRVQKRRC
jgi:hypothetical protein